MTNLLSLALFERGSRLLMTRRKNNVPPFAGSWFLPAVEVMKDESAEEALERHMYHELGLEIEPPVFLHTMYLMDERSNARYVVNVFSLAAPRELRFRAAGDYDDVRWLAASELAGVDTPAALRDWLITGRFASPATAAKLVPLAEDPPDNRAAWNKISRPYQERYKLPVDDIVYGGRSPTESDLRLLGDVLDRHVLVLGCGAGQDCIALAKKGAVVVGIDLSDRQIEYGRRLAEREGVLVTLEQGNVELLNGIEDETQDIALSVHAMSYVERVDRAFDEAFRVLRPNASFVLSVHHPFDVCLEDVPPFGVAKKYWEEQIDWCWDFPESSTQATMRSWYRPVSEWVGSLLQAGFRLEQMLEPQPVAEASEPWHWLGATRDKSDLIPSTLIMKAVKP